MLQDIAHSRHLSRSGVKAFNVNFSFGCQILVDKGCQRVKKVESSRFLFEDIFYYERSNKSCLV